jgi:hypothetical protein
MECEGGPLRDAGLGSGEGPTLGTDGTDELEEVLNGRHKSQISGNRLDDPGIFSMGIATCICYSRTGLDI